jgi:hypothetical protein
MRALFLLLLLVNILFLAWSRWIAPPAQMPGHATPASADAGAIRLLREAPLAQELSSDPLLGQGVTCVSAGPYLERVAAEQSAERLAAQGFTSRLRESRDEVWVGQWVRIEELATPEDAANAMAAVREAGVADAYVLSDETPGNVVSLGVFESSERVEQVSAIARMAGFAPTAVDRFRAADVVWLDIDRRANGGLPGLEVLRGSTEPAGRLELRACPEAGVTQDATAQAEGAQSPDGG